MLAGTLEHAVSVGYGHQWSRWRIDLAYQTEGDVAAAMDNFAGYIKQETLTVDLSAGSMAQALAEETAMIGDEQVKLALRKRESKS